MLVMINRGDYWQCAFVIPKGSHEAVNAPAYPEFRTTIRDLASWLEDRVEELKSWDDVQAAHGAVDRLVRCAPPRPAVHRRR